MAHLQKDSYYSIDIALRSQTPLDFVHFCMLRGLAVSRSVCIQLHQRTEPSHKTLDCQFRVSPASISDLKSAGETVRSAFPEREIPKISFGTTFLRPAANMSIPHSTLPECTTSASLAKNTKALVSLQLALERIGHGETSCILLPAVCKYDANRNVNVKRQQKVTNILWRYPEDALSTPGLKEEQAQLSDVLDAIIRELGMPRSLKEVGVGRNKIDQLAENSLHDRLAATNPLPLKEKQQVLEVLEMVIG